MFKILNIIFELQMRLRESTGPRRGASRPCIEHWMVKAECLGKLALLPFNARCIEIWLILVAGLHIACKTQVGHDNVLDPTLIQITGHSASTSLQKNDGLGNM